MGIFSNFMKSIFLFIITDDIISMGGKSVATGDYNEVWKVQRKIITTAIR